jgi:hypothetical protein
VNNLPFTLWMLGFPPATALSCYLGELAGVHSAHNPANEGPVAIISLALWFGVGWLLYRRGA